MPTLELTDGNFSAFDEVDGSGVPEYPFANRQVKDVVTYLVRRIYEGERAAYTPIAAGTADPIIGGAALLLEEGKPQSLGGDMIRVERAFGPVPLAQVSMDQRKFARPPIDNLYLAGGLGTVWAASLDEKDTSHLFFDRKAATAAAITLGNENATRSLTTGQTQALPSATITVVTSVGTITFATTDSTATIYAAFGGTRSVFKGGNGIDITSTYNILHIDAPGCNVARGSGTGDFSLSGASASGTDAGTIVNVPDPDPSKRAINCVSHNIALGEKVVAWLNNRVVARTHCLAVSTANQIQVPLADVEGKDFACDYIAGASTGLRLVNGTKDCSVRRTENYFRAGVTAGIATLADVPAVPTYEDAIAWFGRILATTLTSATATAATDRLTKTAHGMATGDTFFLLAKTNGAGLSTLTQYWAIKVDNDNWKAATSPANALAGTAVDITSDGTAITVLVPDPWPEIAVSDFQAYMGPVVYKTTEEVQMADALETRNASA